jgi:hypothetical protein
MKMSKSTAIKGEFSSVTGSTTRRMFDASGNFIGLIIKVKEGYQIRRFPDGKVRVKATLREAFQSIARSN